MAMPPMMQPQGPTSSLAGAANGPQPMDGPIPGQSLTAQPKSLPYERPPERTDPQEILDWLFKRLTNRKTAMKTLAGMEMGIPVSTITETVIMAAAAEGQFPIHTGYAVAPALSVMLLRMAKTAGIEPRLTGQSKYTESTKLPSQVMELARKRPNLVKVDKAVDTAEQGRKDVKPDGEMKSTKMGLKVPVGGLGSRI